MVKLHFKRKLQGAASGALLVSDPACVMEFGLAISVLPGPNKSIQEGQHNSGRQQHTYTLLDWHTTTACVQTQTHHGHLTSLLVHTLSKLGLISQKEVALTCTITLNAVHAVCWTFCAP
jgi:hypothetical protein